MRRFARTESAVLRAAIVAAMVAVFMIDAFTPLGVVEWIFYLAPVALSLFLWRPAMPLLVAAVATFLIVVGIYVSPPPEGFPAHIAVMNRSFGVLTIWGVGLIARQFIQSRLALRERGWVRDGQAQVGAALRGEHGLDDLARDVLRVLCEYLDVPVGTLYVLGADGQYRRSAAYALAADGGGPAVIAPGEGLVGQAARDRRLLRLDDVPEGYLAVASSLGRMRPRHVIVSPLSADQDVTGVVELAFVHPIEPSDIDMLTGVGEQIGVALRTVRYRLRLEELLHESQQQAERLQVQQEELRVVNEELEEQSHALRDSQSRLEVQHAELAQANVQLEEQTQEVER